MTGALPPPRRWRKRKLALWLLLVLATVIVAVPLAVFMLLRSGAADAWIRRAVIEQVSNLTGGTVELQSMRVDPLTLRITMQNFTVHGRENAGAPPLFHSDRLEVSVSIDNFWGRKISLRDLTLTHPSIHLQFESDGSSNLPPARAPAQSATTLRQRLFTLVTRRLRIDDGELVFNDKRVPLAASGDRFDLSVDYSQSGGIPSYMGDLNWQQFAIALDNYLPFHSDVSVRFQVQQNSLSVTQLVWTLPHTSIDTQFSVADLSRPVWNFRYRGKLDLQDVRTILRQPTTPDGRVDFNGQGNYNAGKLGLDGSYAGEGVSLHFEWFHAGGFTSRGSYHADQTLLTVPDFSATALGGAVTGQVRLTFADLAFRAQTHIQGISLAAALAAVDNPYLPVNPLHWDAALDVDAVTTWKANFQDVDSRGVSFWAPPAELQSGKIPATAHVDYHYSMATNTCTLASSEIATPSSRLRMNGVLGATDTALDLLLEADDAAPWDDFINTIRGADAEAAIVSGKLNWQGRIVGPLGGPTFTGHVKGTQARYNDLYWDSIEGDLVYEPSDFRLLRASASRGLSSAQLEISLALNEWSFDPASMWDFDATLVRTDSDGLQSLLGWSYPVHGMLSGNFHGGGTRANPAMEGGFDVIDPQGWGWQFDRARGQIALRQGEVRISNAELRLLAPPAPGGAQAAAPPGVLTGNILYRTGDAQVMFDVTGAVVPLSGIERVQAPRLAVGGQLSFHLTGEGPARAPRVDGALRLVDLKLGDDVLGSFQGKLDSDGSHMTLDVDSEIAKGEVHGHAEVALGGDYPVTGRVDLKQFDIDPFITAGLRLQGLTGHSSIDGNVSLSGSLLQPDSLAWDVDLSHVSVSYASVNLESSGPVRLQYRRSEVRVQPATLRGPETDMVVSGSARFNNDSALDLHIVGEVNLRLLSSFVPDLDAQGPARVDAGIAGTLAVPRITGRVRLEASSVRYGDFPTGLSNITGDLVFDASRLTFDNIAAESGGGTLSISGSLTYAGGVRYDLTARSQGVRIRYPVGMSWLAGGTLRLAGDANSSTLSGRVTVERLLMADGFDFGSMVASSVEPLSGPSTNSNFLRNLQFDIQADLAPNARIEWTSARFQSEASIRVRGTWEHPILLGHLHLLNGEMQFRGNRYQLSRGDINFANPFRLDPVIGLEAATTIRQYEVTVNFTGPASHLTMSYRSDPPLPSSDIIALLALGETGEESALRSAPTGGTSQTGASTLLSEAISSQLGGRIQRLFGISHFAVDPSLGGPTAGGATAARVSISQQVSRDLTITYITNINSTQQEVIQIEYALRRDVSIEALRDENGTFSVDIVFKKRFQ